MGATPEFRELVYQLTLRPGANPTSLPLRLAQGTRHLTVETAVTHLDERGHVWRILNAYGPEDEIQRARAAFESGRPPFVLEQRVMGQGRRRLVLWYKYRARLGARRHSVTAFAFQALGRETVITDITRQGHLTVKILYKSGSSVQRFLRRVKKEVAADYEFRLLYVGAPRPSGEALLSAEEERVVRAAREAGYFHVPRRIGVRELATPLGLSPSAVSYRLRHAQRKLLEAYLGGR